MKPLECGEEEHAGNWKPGMSQLKDGRWQRALLSAGTGW